MPNGTRLSRGLTDARIRFGRITGGTSTIVGSDKLGRYCVRKPMELSAGSGQRSSPRSFDEEFRIPSIETLKALSFMDLVEIGEYYPIEAARS